MIETDENLNISVEFQPIYTQHSEYACFSQPVEMSPRSAML